jgi:integrase
MARGESEGSVYQLKTGPNAGKWRGAVVVGWKANGQPDRKTAMRDTETACKAALRELLNKRDAGQLGVRAEDWTIATWLPQWLTVVREQDDTKSKLSAGTRVDYESIIRIWLIPQIGTVRLDKVADRHWVKVREAMKAKGRSQSRIHHAWVVLDSALDAAASSSGGRPKLIPYNPLQSMSPPNVPHKRMPDPEREDIVAIYQTVQGDRDEARWVLALEDGTRQGESLGLEWSNIDLDDRSVRIVQQLRRTRGHHGCGDPIPAPTEDNPERMVYRCGHRYASLCTSPGAVPGTLAILPVKTERGNRTLPLTDDLVDLFTQLRRLQQRERLMAGDAYRTWGTTETGAIYETTHLKDKPREQLDLVFRHPDGRPYDTRYDWAAWYDNLVRAGILDENERGKGTHHGRHAACVNMIDSGVPIAHLSSLMGHAKESFTLEKYGHRSREATNAARELLQAHHGKMRTPAKPALRASGTDDA